MAFSSSSDPLGGLDGFLARYSQNEERYQRMVLGSSSASRFADVVNEADSLAEIHSHMLFGQHRPASVSSYLTQGTPSIATDSTAHSHVFTASSHNLTDFSETSSATDPAGYFFPLPEPAEPSPNGEPLVLFCEFVGLARCDVAFHRHEFWPWVQHIEDVHLRRRLPDSCRCWFCDDVKFRASQNHGDRQDTFRQRMEHIHRHIVDGGYTVEQMRPDFDILKHLHWHNLVDETVYRWARQYEEGPTTTGTYAHDFIPPEQLEASQRGQRLELRETREERRERMARQREQRGGRSSRRP